MNVQMLPTSKLPLEGDPFWMVCLLF